MGSFARRIFRRSGSSLIFVGILLGCQPGSDPWNEQDVRAVLEEQVVAWNAGDIGTYMQGYWRSDSTIFISGGSRNNGYDSVLARYERSYPDKAAMGYLTFEELEILELSPRSALARGVWRLKREHDEPWGRFTLVLEKKAEGWRITYDHTSSAP